MLELIVTSSVLIATILLVRWIFREKVSRRFLYALWLLAVLRLLLPFPLLESGFSVMNGFPEIPRTQEVYSLPVNRMPVKDSGVVVSDNGTIHDTNSFGYAQLSPDGTTVTRYAAKLDVKILTGIVWASGSILVGAWLVFCNVRFTRKLRRTRQAISADCMLPVYISDSVPSPCLCGVFRPAVYLTPKSAQPEMLPYVLTHELCHYRHKDHLWNLLRGVLLTAYWWNPPVWLAAVLSKSDAELACDEAVLAQIGDDRRIAYGKTLLEMVHVQPSVGTLALQATAMVSGKRELRERVTRIAKRPRMLLPALLIALLLIGVSVGCTFTGARTDGYSIIITAACRAEGLREDGDGAYLAIVADGNADLAGISDAREYRLTQELARETFEAQLPRIIGVTLTVELPRDVYRKLDASAKNALERQPLETVVYGGLYGEYVTVTGISWDDSDGTESTLTSCNLTLFSSGTVTRMFSAFESDTGYQTIRDVWMSYMFSSYAEPGPELTEYIEVRMNYENGETHSYYAYEENGRCWMQFSEDGMRGPLSQENYGKLLALLDVSPGKVPATASAQTTEAPTASNGVYTWKENTGTLTAPALTADMTAGVDVLVDYADVHTLVFHGYFGLFVYDLDEGCVMYAYDLGQALGTTIVQGSDCALVGVSEDGATIQLLRMTDTGVLPWMYEIDTRTGAYAVVPTSQLDAYFDAESVTDGILYGDGGTIGTLTYQGTALFEGYPWTSQP